MEDHPNIKKPEIRFLLFILFPFFLFISCATIPAPQEDLTSLDYYSRALNRLESGNIKQACSDLESVLMLEKKPSGFLFSELARCRLMQGDYIQALTNFRKAWETEPEKMEFGLDLASLYLTMDRIPEADKTYRSVLAADPSSVEALYGLAVCAELDGRPALAVPLYRRLLVLDPSHLSSALNLMNILIDSKQYTEGIELFNSLNPLLRESPLLLLEKAFCLKKKGKYGEALTDLRTIGPGFESGAVLSEQAECLYFLDKKEECLQVLDQLEKTTEPGFLYSAIRQELEGSDFERALLMFDQIISIDPNNPLPRHGRFRSLKALGRTEEALEELLDLGRIHYAENNFTTALDLFRRAKEIFPSSHIPYYLSAIVHENTGEPEQSILELKEAIQIEPTSSTLYSYLGSLYEQTGDFESAYQTFRKALEFHMTNTTVLVRLGYLASILDQSGESIKFYKKAISQTSTDPALHMILGLTYLNFNQYSNAVFSLGQCLILEPGNADAYYYLALCADRMKDTKKAVTNLRLAILYNDEFADAQNYLGYLLLEQEDRIDEAISIINRALKLSPGNPAYLDSLGWAYYKLKEYTRAIALLKKSLSGFLEIDIQEPVVYEHLGDVYYAQENYKKAVNYWTEAVRLNPSDSVQKKIEKAREMIVP